MRLRDVEIVSEFGDGRPAVVCDGVEDLVVASLNANAPINLRPALVLRNVQHVFVQGCRAVRGSSCFLALEGAGCDGITLASNDLSGAAQMFKIGVEVARRAITVK